MYSIEEIMEQCLRSSFHKQFFVEARVALHWALNETYKVMKTNYLEIKFSTSTSGKSCAKDYHFTNVIKDYHFTNVIKILFYPYVKHHNKISEKKNAVLFH